MLCCGVRERGIRGGADIQHLSLSSPLPPPSALEELLDRTRGSMDEMHLSAVTQLLSAKARVEAAGERPGMEDLLALLYSATQVWGVPVWGGVVS